MEELEIQLLPKTVPWMINSAVLKQLKTFLHFPISMHETTFVIIIPSIICIMRKRVKHDCINLLHQSYGNGILFMIFNGPYYLIINWYVWINTERESSAVNFCLPCFVVIHVTFLVLSSIVLFFSFKGGLYQS